MVFFIKFFNNISPPWVELTTISLYLILTQLFYTHQSTSNIYLYLSICVTRKNISHNLTPWSPTLASLLTRANVKECLSVCWAGWYMNVQSGKLRKIKWLYIRIEMGEANPRVRRRLKSDTKRLEERDFWGGGRKKKITHRERRLGKIFCE